MLRLGRFQSLRGGIVETSISDEWIVGKYSGLKKEYTITDGRTDRLYAMRLQTPGGD
jgi:hypothetical protein